MICVTSSRIVIYQSSLVILFFCLFSFVALLKKYPNDSLNPSLVVLGPIYPNTHHPLFFPPCVLYLFLRVIFFSIYNNLSFFFSIAFICIEVFFFLYPASHCYDMLYIVFIKRNIRD
eukprot:UN10817